MCESMNGAKNVNMHMGIHLSCCHPQAVYNENIVEMRSPGITDISFHHRGWSQVTTGMSGTNLSSILCLSRWPIKLKSSQKKSVGAQVYAPPNLTGIALENLETLEDYVPCAYGIPVYRVLPGFYTIHPIISPLNDPSSAFPDILYIKNRVYKM